MSLQLMKKRVEQSGASLHDEQIKDAQDILAYGFKDDVSHAKQVYFWIPGETPHKGDHLDIKFQNRKYSSANGNTQEFLTQNKDRIEVGDYIYNEKDNTYWICTESFNVDDIHYEGKFTQCNWRLRWQRRDGTILEYPCQDLNSTQYNSGESGNNIVRLGSAQHMETVQATDDTICLASPQRFYISRSNSIPFIVTQNDTTASNYGKGLCKITLTQDTNKSDKDRPDLGICDYIEPLSPLPPSSDETTVLNAIISGNPNLKNGLPRTYAAIFTDGDGNEVDWNDVDFAWNIASDFGVEQTVTDNTTKLSVNDEDLIGSSFSLQILIDGEVKAQLTVTIVESF